MAHGSSYDPDPTSAQGDDRALVARCLAGERAAERDLWRRQRGRVHATLYRVLGQNRDVEDLIQESFLEVFRSLKGFRGEARLSTWIDRITVRVAYRYLSTRKPTPAPLEMMAEPAADEDIEARTRAREGVRRLYAVLGAMSAHAQLAFTLHVIDGRPLAEVARLVGATGMATKVRVWRARRELERRAAADPVLAELLGEGATQRLAAADALHERAGKEPA